MPDTSVSEEELELHVEVPKPEYEQKYEALKNETLKTLRSYAANKLGIKGASKIPGGRDALLDAILDVLKNNS